MKLWQKGISTNEFVLNFTKGKDQETDLYLAAADILGSIAHAKMLGKAGLLDEHEVITIHWELVKMYDDAQKGKFRISDNCEDVHSEIEKRLTETLGETGKKIHSSRSRNDQVLLDIRLFTRHKLLKIRNTIGSLFHQLQQLSEENKDVLMPGYTHLQLAMPSSFGLWFGAYAESLVDDMALMLSAYLINNQNPLGSAAGYGTSFPINRSYTSSLLGFDDLAWNVVYAQMSRGKTERTVSYALANIAYTIGKMAGDICLFMSQNYAFLYLPDEFTTGSSIMPHKKNPDFFEIIRAKCNHLQSIPAQIGMMITNLPSGYFRDMQIVKEIYLPVFDQLLQIIQAIQSGLEQIRVKKEILENPLYDCIFTVEKVNKLVIEGMAFREAYLAVAEELESGKYIPEKVIEHTHEGSIGNLCNQQIKLKFEKVFCQFKPENVKETEQKLLNLN